MANEPNPLFLEALRVLRDDIGKVFDRQEEHSKQITRLELQVEGQNKRLDKIDTKVHDVKKMITNHNKGNGSNPGVTVSGRFSWRLPTLKETIFGFFLTTLAVAFILDKLGKI